MTSYLNDPNGDMTRTSVFCLFVLSSSDVLFVLFSFFLVHPLTVKVGTVVVCPVVQGHRHEDRRSRFKLYAQRRSATSKENTCVSFFTACMAFLLFLRAF